MTSISVTLIRTTHSDFDIDNPEDLRIIRLNKQGIRHLDNLEVFSHISELHLADNDIEQIENIDFLFNLTFLDLSNNKISSDGLLTSIGLLPQSIKTINLSGNPCAEDESCLIALQDSCPELNIIVGVYAGGEPLEDLEHLEHSEDLNHLERSEYKNRDDDITNYPSRDEDDEEEGEEGDMPLNADEVLKSLVERKCRLQSLETFSVTKTTEDLDSEYESAVQTEAERSLKRRITSQLKHASHSRESFEKRLEDIKGGGSEGKDISDFRSRLKDTVRNAREAIQAKQAEYSLK